MTDPTALSKPAKGCRCASLGDLAVVPMGGDGLDERVFATLEIVRAHDGHCWWLYLSECSTCRQYWMVAQEERIFDDYFLRRLTAQQAREVTDEGRWPPEFITYERVLNVGRMLSRPCIFLDALSSSLIWTAQDLRKERPDISIEEIADLIGVSPAAVCRLLAA